ncbi:MAG TPA: xylulokinase [Thermoleophilaceae bacterium]|nr:xylulokinase [Thermoleophilaceae bacterium]
MLVAGVDTSTQATKVLVVDPDDGRVVALGRAPHEVTGTHGARETDPEVWWRALRLALEETGAAGQVEAISVAGQQHGLVVLDGDGRPLRSAILWNDTRSATEARELTEMLGGPAEWAERVGLVPVPSFTATRWAWLRRHEPERAEAARAVRLPHDFVTERLCGHGATDRGDASGTAWWSTRDEAYLDEVLELIELDPALLPHVLGPREAAGEVTATAAHQLGLRAGALVGPGTGDNMGAALGLGARPGEPVVSLGTSGTAYALMDKRAVDPSGTVAGFADATGRFLPLAATLNATLAVDRVAGWLGLDREAAAERTEVVVLPYLDGERTPNLPRAAGMVAGLRHATTREEILLAAYEGAAASLVEALDRLDEQGSGLDPEAAILLVGGGARGPAWQRTVARLSGRPVQVPDAEELVALGAAAQAAACVYGEAPEEVARRWDARSGTTVEAPTERDVETLERIRATREATLALHER